MDKTDDVLSESIVKTLLYFDIFSYPLTVDEVFLFLPTNHVCLNDVDKRLYELVHQGVVYRLGNFYSVKNDESLRERRILGNQMASLSLPAARKRAKMIARFPFVQAVFISGSLSKGYMDEKSDLDFFIVTKPSRLWISRTLMVVFKRVFLGNQHKKFCINYFVDSEHLEIEEKNLFTAVELATLIPACSREMYVDLMEHNAWIKRFFPNYESRSVANIQAVPSSGVKRAMENVINLLYARRIEDYFKSITYQRWNKKYRQHYPAEDFDIAFKTKDYTSKNHPNHYQKKVLHQYDEKVKEHAIFHQLS